MKNLNTNKIDKSISWLSLLLLGLVTCTFTACENDEGEITNNGAEAETASLVTFGQDTPGGWVTYMTVFEDAPTKIDIGDAVELGGSSSRVLIHGSDIYSYDPAASTITKWNVDRSSLELNPSSIISFASLGHSDGATPFISSDNQAFIFSLNEGLVTEWNPSTMEIIENITVPSNPLAAIHPETSPSTLYGYLLNNSNIALPVWYDQRVCCDYVNPGGAMVAVYNPTSKSIDYKQDSRLISGQDKFVVNDNGDMYQVPVVYNWFIDEYYNESNYPLHSILKFNSNGDYDKSFEFDLEDYIPIKITREVAFISEDNIVCVYYDTTYQAQSWENKYHFFSQPSIKVSINLNTLEVEPFTALDEYNSFFHLNTIDGVNYIRTLQQFENQSTLATILRENSFGDYTVVTTLEGYTTSYEKLW